MGALSNPGAIRDQEGFAGAQSAMSCLEEGHDSWSREASEARRMLGMYF